MRGRSRARIHLRDAGQARADAMPRLVAGNRAERQHARRRRSCRTRRAAAAAARRCSCRRGRCSRAAAARRTRSRAATRPTRVTRGSFAGRLDRAGVPLGIDDHRPELEGGEHPAVLADALLHEEHRPAVLELDRRARSARRPARTPAARRRKPAMSNSRFMRRPPLPRGPARARRPGDRARTTPTPRARGSPIASRSLRLIGQRDDRCRKRCRVAGRRRARRSGAARSAPPPRVNGSTAAMYGRPAARIGYSLLGTM